MLQPLYRNFPLLILFFISTTKTNKKNKISKTKAISVLKCRHSICVVLNTKKNLLVANMTLVEDWVFLFVFCLFVCFGAFRCCCCCYYFLNFSLRVRETCRANKNQTLAFPILLFLNIREVGPERQVPLPLRYLRMRSREKLVLFKKAEVGKEL